MEIEHEKSMQTEQVEEQITYSLEAIVEEQTTDSIEAIVLGCFSIETCLQFHCILLFVCSVHC